MQKTFAVLFMWLLSSISDSSTSEACNRRNWIPVSDNCAARLALAWMANGVEARRRQLIEIAELDSSFCCWLMLNFGGEANEHHCATTSSRDHVTLARLAEQAAGLRRLPLVPIACSRRLGKQLTKAASKLNARTLALADLADRLHHLNDPETKPGLARLLALATAGSSWLELGGQLHAASRTPQVGTALGVGSAPPAGADEQECRQASLPLEFQAALDQLEAPDEIGEPPCDLPRTESASLAAAVRSIRDARQLLSEPGRPEKKRIRRALKSARRAGKRGRELWRPADGLTQDLTAQLIELASGSQQGFSADFENEKLESLAEFAAGAGHEINNPIAVISGRASLLARGESDPKRRRDLAVIKAQADRVYEMIAAMMFFARPPQPDVAEFDLAEVLKKLLSEISEIAALREIELATEGLWRPIPLQADAVQVAAALKAVYDNALFAIGQNGRIITSAAVDEEEETVRVIIRDTGPGIPPEVRRHLFDPYFSGRQSGRGLGMGLSKAWRIINQHAGTIEVESNSGEHEYGATFVITLPFRDSHAD